MTNNNLVSMAQQFTGLPMGALIGAPLNAAAEANAAMACSQTRFILDTCFFYAEADKDKQVKDYHPIMIKMVLTRGVLNPDTKSSLEIEEVKTTFDLPLITIMPINSLGVDDVDVAFEMEVKSSYSDEQSSTVETHKKGEVSWESSLNFSAFSSSIKGNASYDYKDASTHNTHYQKSNSAKYTVKVHAGQLPVPKGVNTIIEAFTRSIEPIVMPTSSNE